MASSCRSGRVKLEFMLSTNNHRPVRALAPPEQEQLIRVWVNTFEAGLTQIGAMPYVIVCMHLGASVEVRCIRGAFVRHGREVAGDLDIIPARTPSAWETGQAGTTLIMCVSDTLLRTVAGRLDNDRDSIEIADRFQMRDPVIEHLGWSLKADIDAGRIGGQFFRESMGTALATRLLQRHYRGSLPMREARGGLCQPVLERVLAYIEDNLARKLSLAEIAGVAGMSVSHLKTLFKNAMSVPAYEYVLRRRVERAQLLLRDGSLTVSEVAVATGFAHQSHLARHMQKVLGSTPTAVRRNLTQQVSARPVAAY